jgi:hypothetical protein
MNESGFYLAAAADQLLPAFECSKCKLRMLFLDGVPRPVTHCSGILSHPPANLPRRPWPAPNAPKPEFQDPPFATYAAGERLS